MQRKERIPDIKIADIDVGGDYHRVILGGVNVPSGKSAFDVRAEIMRDYDELRQLLLSFPFGNEDMCANLVFPSIHPEAPFGQITMECMGYPHFSGSNTSATIAALLNYGLVPTENGSGKLSHEVPSGIIEAEYRMEDAVIEEIVIRGDDSYVIDDCLSINVPDFGMIDYDLVWCGACFIMVDASRFGIDIDEAHIPKMKAVGLAISEAIKSRFKYEHPVLGPMDTPGFVNFMGPCVKNDERHYSSQGAIYGHPDTVFRCPTGTGTAARMALEVTRGNMEANAELLNTSATDTQFIGRGLGWSTKAGQDMLSVAISSKPFVLSTTTLHLDFDNPSLVNFKRLANLLGP